MDDEIQDIDAVEPDHQDTLAEEAHLKDADTIITANDDLENELDVEYKHDMDIGSIDGDSGNVKSLALITDDLSDSDHVENEFSELIDEETSEGVEDDVSFVQAEGQVLIDELESRIVSFEERLSEMQLWIESGFDTNGTLISSLGDDLQKRAEDTEVKQLKKDFDHFSKKLRRVVQAEDSVNAEALDATKVPPDVLEITYAKTLNDLYSAMLGIYGDRESCDMVEDARENVRQFSAGVDFFRFENETFIVRGLSDAISAKIVSVKQIHGTYIELFKMLYEHVPNYNSQDFRAFVETGSREYTIEKVVSHETCLDRITSDVAEFRDELSNITENVSFMAELQNNQLEEMTGKAEELDELREQMKAIAKAVNLHTKAINKLNKTLIELKDLPVSQSNIAEPVEIPDISKIEDMVVSKANKEDITAISGEMESFKASVEEMFTSIQQQLEDNILNSQKLEGLEDELSVVHEEIGHLHVAEGSKPVKLADIPIEDAITGQLSVLGSATLKQLEKHINEQGFSIDHEKLSLVMSYLEQEQLVSSMKKGRYTFYSVTGPVKV